MGKAKARVEASRDTLYRAAEAAYDDVVSSHALLSVDAKIRLQLAVCFAAEACAEAVRFVNDVTGASSIRVEHPSNATSVTRTCCCSTPPSPVRDRARPAGYCSAWTMTGCG
jgi:alkylation response protein AidB-like acyl-CoA dehydrogenase